MIKKTPKSTKQCSQQQEQNQDQIILKNLVNFIPKDDFLYIGCNNKILYLYGKEILISIQYFNLNGQIKLLKQFKFMNNIKSIFFMNESNQFITLSNDELYLWKLNGSQIWYCYKTILTYEKMKKHHRAESFYCLELSQKNDLIVTSRFNNIYFLEKNDKNEWKQSQMLKGSLDGFLNFRLNEKGTTLITFNFKFNHVQKRGPFIVLKKNKIDGLWTIIHEIENFNSLVPFGYCFIDNESFVIFRKCLPTTIWKVSSSTQKVEKFQESTQLEFQSEEENNVCFKTIKYFQFQDLFCAEFYDTIYFIKQKRNKFEVKLRITICGRLDEISWVGQENVILGLQNEYDINKLQISKIYQK